MSKQGAKLHFQTAIDFGISNTKVITFEQDGAWRGWTVPTVGNPTPDSVTALLAQGGVDLAALTTLAVTGGRHRLLPNNIGACRVVSVGELQAIGRGGQAIVALDDAPRAAPILVISAGSGTAVVRAQEDQFSHVTGTAVGGGTLLGLGRLLLQTVDPSEIDGLAQQGNANGVDLSLADVITGPIGSLPANATAVNFGRLARSEFVPRREDLAAALVTLVGQTIALVSINAARAQRIDHVVVTGHLIDQPSMRAVLAGVGAFYGARFDLPDRAGYATALGAALSVGE